MATKRKLRKHELLEFIRRSNGKATVRTCAIFMYGEDEYHTRRSVRSTIQHLRRDGAVIVNSGNRSLGFLRVESDGNRVPMNDARLREMMELTTAARSKLFDMWQLARYTILYVSNEYKAIEQSYHAAGKALEALCTIARERGWTEDRIALYTGATREQN